jgi:hypothetical protein
MLPMPPIDIDSFFNSDRHNDVGLELSQGHGESGTGEM